jgi:hypothetical protein
MAKSKRSRKEMIESNPTAMVRYWKGLEYVRQQYEDVRDFQTECRVYWGPTGSGKTYHVNELVQGSEVFYLTKAMATAGQVWWDGYEDQPIVVLEEFYGWIPVSILLNMINSTPFKVPVKGGSRSFLAKTVYITSNSSPSTWYKMEEVDAAVKAAYNRRFTPPFGFVFYVGYGPNKDQKFCTCKDDQCWRQHESIDDDEGDRAFADGLRF